MVRKEGGKEGRREGGREIYIYIYIYIFKLQFDNSTVLVRAHLSVELSELCISAIDIPFLIFDSDKHLVDMVGIRATPSFDN